MISSVPAEFVHLINLPALESSSSVQKLSWALPPLSPFYPTVGTAAFTPGVWQSLRCPQISSGAGAWEGITCGAVKSCCCCFFRWWFLTLNPALLNTECLTKCHYPTPLLPGNFHPPKILIGSVHVERTFFFYPQENDRMACTQEAKESVRFPVPSPAGRNMWNRKVGWL